MGSTGPRSERPGGAVWGTDFPPLTMRDMVRAQQMLMRRWASKSCSPSLADRWAACRCCNGRRLSRPGVRGRADRDCVVSLGPEHRVQRGEPAGDRGRSRFSRRRYWAEGRVPARGLAVARMMAAHHLPVGGGADPEIRPQAAPRGQPGGQFLRRRVRGESYLRHQGSSFVRRFDANSYLTVTRAMDGSIYRPSMTATWQRHSRARKRGSAWCRSRRTGCFRPRNRAAWRVR